MYILFIELSGRHVISQQARRRLGQTITPASDITRSFHVLDQSFAETFAETKDQPKCEVVFFVWTQRFSERLAETKLRTERSLNPKLINSPVYFASTR